MPAPFLDWSNGTPEVSGSQALVIEQASDDQINAYYENALAGLQALRAEVDASGIASGLGIVSFGTFDDAMRDITERWANETDHTVRFLLADKLVNLFNVAEAGYLNGDGTVKSKFTVSGRLADDIAALKWPLLIGGALVVLFIAWRELR
jgi:hypothetical protein